MKHKIQVLFVLLLTISLLAAPASAISFPDVGVDAWYSDAVEYVSDIGIMIGDTQGKFNPNKPVTRAEMAAVICRALEVNLDESDYNNDIYLTAENYSDVSESHWAYGYVSKASSLEIVKGYGNGRFGPSDQVTYEQAVTMIVRTLGAGTDAENRGGYPNGFLIVADEIGLLSGVRATVGEKLSRANVAVLLFNYFHINSAENIQPDNNFVITPEDEIGDNAQDNQDGDALEIGDLWQEDQPENGSESEGVGGGT